MSLELIRKALEDPTPDALEWLNAVPSFQDWMKIVMCRDEARRKKWQ